MSTPAGAGALRHGADAALADDAVLLTRLRSFHTLDALRGIAALAVVLFHTAFIYGITPPAEGQIAVDLFFVMSGFIIAYRYEDDLRSRLSLGGFIRARLIRLYPLFFLGTLLGVIPAVIAVAAGKGDALHLGLIESFPLAVAMLPSHFAQPKIDELYPINYVAWSLALELAINVVYAASIRFWTIRRLLFVVGGAFAGLVVCEAFYGSLIGGYAWANAPVGVARVVYGFATGVLIFQLHRRKAFRMRVPWWSLLGVSAAIFLFEPPFGKAVWELFVVTAVVPLIVVGAIANEPPKAARNACVLAGIFSYVVYSLHAPLVSFFLRGEERMHLDLHHQTPLEALVFTGLLVALCLAAHIFYDKPVRRFLTRRWAASDAGVTRAPFRMAASPRS